MLDKKMENIIKSEKFYFYCRKILFQIVIPGLLAIISIINFIKNEESHMYNSLYFYIWVFLMIYTGFKYTIEFVFKNCNIKILTKLSNTSIENNTYIPYKTIRFIKLRYSSYNVFIKLEKLCWILGLDSPTFVSGEVLAKLLQLDVMPTDANDDIILDEFMTKLYDYRPKLIKIQLNDTSTNSDNQVENSSDNLIDNIITKSDYCIYRLQKHVYNLNYDIPTFSLVSVV